MHADRAIHEPHPGRHHQLPPHHSSHPHQNGNGQGHSTPHPPLHQQPINGTSQHGPLVSPSNSVQSTLHPAPSAPTRPLPESLIRLQQANESTWLAVGGLAERMGDDENSLKAFENALRHNPKSIEALLKVASISRSRDDLARAVSHWQRVLEIQPENGEIWAAMGHCFLMQDDLQKAYAAYQQALYFLPNPKDPKLWYGIGILYDRYGSLEHAEEAFSSVLRMDAEFDKADEIYFRLGIIYKQQQKYAESLDCFDRILRSPPNPLANLDIWFQIGHVYEQQKDYAGAKGAYERVLLESPNHAKVLQQLGWLYHQTGSNFSNQDMAIQYLTKSLESDGSDAQSWYLLGRAYMAGQKYQKAYEAYQQAVYRDGRNPTFWCSIGVLYYNINQFRDALDAYSRAIRINPYISEVWFDLGSLYESCNNQIADAIDAYARAADLDPTNMLIKQRLTLLKDVQRNGGQIPAAPGPQDVHPTAYATAGPPTVLSGHGPQRAQPHPGHPARPDSRGHPDGALALSGRDLPAPGANGVRGSSPDMPYRQMDEPFRGGPPPPLNLDDSNRRGLQHAPLAPMEVDRPGPPSSYPPSVHVPPVRPGSTSSAAGSHTVAPLLHHPQPHSQIQSIAQMQQQHPVGNGGPLPSQTLPPMVSRAASEHQSSGSGGSPRSRRNTAITPPASTYSSRAPVPFAAHLPPPPSTHPNAQAYTYPNSNGSSTPGERDHIRHEHHWERQGERKREPSPSNQQTPHRSSHGNNGSGPSAYYQSPQQQPHPAYEPRRPSPSHSHQSHHAHHPSQHGRFDPARQSQRGPSPQYQPMEVSEQPRRYDPRFDGDQPAGRDRDQLPIDNPPYPDRAYNRTPDAPPPPRRNRGDPVADGGGPGGDGRHGESPSPGPSNSARPVAAPEPQKEKRRRVKDKDKEEKPTRERRERKAASRKVKDDTPKEDSVMKPPTSSPPATTPYTPFRGGKRDATETPGPSTKRSSQATATPYASETTRELDEDYDGGAAETLIGMASRTNVEPERARAPTGMGLASILGPSDGPSPAPTRRQSTSSYAPPPTQPNQLPPVTPRAQPSARYDPITRRSPPPRSENNERATTPMKRPRPSSPIESQAEGTNNKRTRIEILNRPPASSASSTSPSAHPNLHSSPPSAQRPASDTQPNESQARAVDGNARPSQSAESPHTPSVQRPSPPPPRSGSGTRSRSRTPVPKTARKPTPPNVAQDTSVQLPPITTLSPPPASPKAITPEARARSEATSDMLIDSDESRASSENRRVAESKAARITTPPTKIASPRTGGDAMVVDS